MERVYMHARVWGCGCALVCVRACISVCVLQCTRASVYMCFSVHVLPCTCAAVYACFSVRVLQCTRASVYVCFSVCVLQFPVPYQKRQDLEEEREHRDVPGLLASGKTEILTFPTQKLQLGLGKPASPHLRGCPQDWKLQPSWPLFQLR